MTPSPLIRAARRVVLLMTPDELAMVQAEIDAMPGIRRAFKRRDHKSPYHTASAYCVFCVAEAVEVVARRIDQQ